MNRCEEIEILLEERRVGLLDDARSREVDGHLSGCPRCSEAYATIASIEESISVESELDPLSELEVRSRLAKVEARLARAERWKGAFPMIAAASLIVGILTWLFVPQDENDTKTPWQEPKLRTEPEKLYPVPPDLTLERTLFTPDGNHVAYVCRKGEGYVVVNDGTAGPLLTDLNGPFIEYGFIWYEGYIDDRETYLGLGSQLIGPFKNAAIRAFHPDPERCLVHVLSKDGKHLLLHGSKTIEIDGEIEEAVTNHDFSRIAYSYKTKEGKSVLVSAEGNRTQHDETDRLRFIGKNDQLSYVSRDGEKSTFHNGDEPPQIFDNIEEVTFASDGTSYAYRARIENDWFIVHDGKRGEEFDMVSAPVLSGDGKTVAYACREGNNSGWHLVVGEQHSKLSFDMVSNNINPITQITFSPSGRHVAYRAESDQRRDSSKYQVFWFSLEPGQDKEFYDYSIPCDLRFCSDEILAILPYAGSDDDRNDHASVIIVRNGVTLGGETFDEVKQLSFNPAFSSSAYVARLGKREFVVIDHVRQKEKYTTITDLQFAPDMKSVAYVGHKHGKSVVVVGNQRSEEFDEASALTFTPDGKKALFGARIGNEVWWKTMELK